jgi:hypothetical protein
MHACERWGDNTIAHSFTVPAMAARQLVAARGETVLSRLRCVEGWLGRTIGNAWPTRQEPSGRISANRDVILHSPPEGPPLAARRGASSIDPGIERRGRRHAPCGPVNVISGCPPRGVSKPGSSAFLDILASGALRRHGWRRLLPRPPRLRTRTATG